MVCEGSCVVCEGSTSLHVGMSRVGHWVVTPGCHLCHDMINVYEVDH